MVIVSASKFISASRESVWQVISNIDCELACWPSIKSISMLRQERRQILTIFGFKYIEAVELQPGKSMNVNILQGPFTGFKRIELKPAASNGIIVNIYWNITLGSNKMLSIPIRWYMIHQTHNALERIAALATDQARLYNNYNVG